LRFLTVVRRNRRYPRRLWKNLWATLQPMPLQARQSEAWTALPIY